MKKLIAMLLSFTCVLTACTEKTKDQKAGPGGASSSQMTEKENGVDPFTPSESAFDTYTDVAVMSTTDMHGKCWSENVLNDTDEKHSMLRVSTAVKKTREMYGEENVILIDNGDLFQGTPVSQTQLMEYSSGKSKEPPAMALCLREIGYTVFSLGNHEFNYDFQTMSDTYAWLSENGVSVISSNINYDGTDGVHKDGENAFAPYVIKTVQVNGHEHKIGILGMDNCDIPRWDLPGNYPGLRFVHPGNDAHSMAYEADIYLPKMKEEGCEFIIVTYHGGLGEDSSELRYGENTEDQGKRLVAETEGIDFLIVGHDHESFYSNCFLRNKNGGNILVVNGGGQQLTRTVFRFYEDRNGNLLWTLSDTHNLILDAYPEDEELKEKIRPYAKAAEEAVSLPCGRASGEWDKSRDFYTRQTDSMDLVQAANMEILSGRLEAKYKNADSMPEVRDLKADHLKVDMCITNVPSGDLVVDQGDISMKDIYRLYKYANSAMVIPMKGEEIRAVMEENAERFQIAKKNGRGEYSIVGDKYSYLLFGGVNFTYDLSKDRGERVEIGCFPDGSAFSDEKVYLVAVNQYILGNEKCGLRQYSPDDAVWSEEEEAPEECVQDLIAEYITRKTEEKGALTPDEFNWKWEIVQSV